MTKNLKTLGPGPWALAGLGILTLLPLAAFAQGAAGFRERTVLVITAGEWTGPRLPDGQPDVQGHWSNTIGNHNNFTDPQGAGPDEQEGARARGPRASRAPSRVSDPPSGVCELAGPAITRPRATVLSCSKPSALP